VGLCLRSPRLGANAEERVNEAEAKAVLSPCDPFAPVKRREGDRSCLPVAAVGGVPGAPCRKLAGEDLDVTQVHVYGVESETATGTVGVLAALSPVARRRVPDALPRMACRSAALGMAVAFWFDGGLFKLPTAAMFWALLELGNSQHFISSLGGKRGAKGRRIVPTAGMTYDHKRHRSL